MHYRKGKQSHPFQYLTQIFKILLLGLLVLSIIFILNQIHLSDLFPIRTAKVYGIKHVQQEEVQELVTPMLNRGYFQVNIESMRDRLIQIPWVSEIYVRRAWPDQVLITIIEKNAIARWNEKDLLSSTGEIFLPNMTKDLEDLPSFSGPEGKQMIMLQYFAEINRILQPLRAKISFLELTPYSTWKMTLDNGIALQVGHKDILTRLSHFVKVYPKIIGERAVDVDYIDLRYSNGVSVKWKGTTIGIRTI